MEQLILVEITDEVKVYLQTWQNKWKTEKVFSAVIGENGFTTNKIEGDKKTPLGLFKLGPAFGKGLEAYNYPYFRIDEDTYWVNDGGSPFYNNIVEVGSALNTDYPYIKNTNRINWKTSEHLIAYKEYDLGLVIEYNVHSEVNRGSAICMHVKTRENTSGCIALNREDLIQVINFLDDSKNPHILIKSN